MIGISNLHSHWLRRLHLEMYHNEALLLCSDNGLICYFSNWDLHIGVGYFFNLNLALPI